MAAYDDKVTAAHVRAYADEFGIVVAGAINPDLTGADRAVLDRRKVSGDWREIGGGLSLVEVLALSPGPRAHSEPGFPVETHARNGRQVTLVASLGPDPAAFRAAASPVVDVDALADALERRQADRAAAAAARAELAATVEADEQKLAMAARGGLAAMLGEE
jgi:hypothetical protein